MSDKEFEAAKAEISVIAMEAYMKQVKLLLLMGNLSINIGLKILETVLQNLGKNVQLNTE